MRPLRGSSKTKSMKTLSDIFIRKLTLQKNACRFQELDVTNKIWIVFYQKNIMHVKKSIKNLTLHSVQQNLLELFILAFQKQNNSEIYVSNDVVTSPLLISTIKLQIKITAIVFQLLALFTYTFWYRRPQIASVDLLSGTIKFKRFIQLNSSPRKNQYVAYHQLTFTVMCIKIIHQQ